MILLFLSVWAIIIALNEVLFAAQPFSMISIAAALPHTLMFSVVLSAAVYVAKKKILDAIDKGQPIDKRFVADLTPEVGHELNAMRKQLTRMDEQQLRGQSARAQALARARARARAQGRKGNKKGKLTAQEIEQANRERLAQNRDTYGHLYQTAQAKLRQDELKKQRARQKAHAKATQSKEARARAALKSGQVAVAAARKAAQAQDSGSSFLSGLFSQSDPNDFVKQAHAQHLEQSQERAEVQQGQIKAKVDKLAAAQKAAAASTTPSAAATAAQKRAQEEQARARRQAKIDALGAISSEDKLRQEQELKERKAKEAAAAKAKQAKAVQEQAKLQQLKQSLDPNASRAEIKAQTQKIKEQGSAAKAAAEKAAAEKAAAEQKAAAEKAAAEKAAAEKAAAEKAAAEKAAAEKAAAEKAAQQAAAQKAAQSKAQREADTAAFMQGATAAVQQSAKSVSDLERLQAQAQHMQGSEAKGAAKAAAASVGYMDQLIIPKSDNIDASGLKKHQGPKRGAGLDTSALKRVGEIQDSSPSTFNPPQLVKKPVQGAGVSSAGGARFLNSNSTRSAMKVESSKGGAAAAPSAQMAGAAFGTTLQNDATIERGKANTLDFASYQANARERALGRAQTPKATAQAQHMAAATHRSVTGMNMNTQTQAPTGGKLTAPGNRMAFKAQMQRPGLASTHLGDNGPLRQVVAGTKPVVGPTRDTLPKVLPSPGIESIQTAPKLRAKRVINATNSSKNDEHFQKVQKRDDMYKRELNFVDEAPSKEKMEALAAQTDKLHAQDHADAYSKVQETTAKSQGQGEHHFKRARARPSDKLRADEQV